MSWNQPEELGVLINETISSSQDFDSLLIQCFKWKTEMLSGILHVPIRQL